DRLRPGTPAYNVPAPMRLHGPLDAGALDRALDALRERHEILRTTFAERDGEPVQVIHPFAPVPLAVDDLSHLPDDAREAEARRRVDEDAHTGFDLERGPLFRVRLARLGEDEHLLLLTFHHAVIDAWSLGVFTRELAELYGALVEGRPSPLEPVPLQYADFAAWHREQLSGAALERHLAFWRQALEGAPPALELPAFAPRPPEPSGRGDSLEVRLPAAAAERIRAMAAAEGSTPFAVLLAAFRLALARHSGQDDVVLGTAAAGRERRELAGMMGFVANTLALRTRLGGDPEFRELVRRERDTLLDAFEHQALPFERVVEELRLAPDPSRNPVFQAMLTFQDAGELAAWDGGMRLGAAEAHGEALEFRSSKFDLSVSVTLGAGELWVQVQWAADLLERADAERLAGRFLRLLEQGVEAPGRRLSQLDGMEADERTRVLGAWTRGESVAPAAGPVHRLFEAHAARTPDAPALAWDGGNLSYADLDRRANRLARRLRALGVGPEARVGVALERSPELVVAVLGVLKAGGAYVPLDPSLPEERLGWMAEDAGVRALVVRNAAPAGLIALSLPTVSIEGDADALAAEPGDALGGEVPEGALAYVIYTSGSTGRPKGVMVEHGGIARHCAAAAAAYGLTPEDRVLQFAAPGFDVSVEQILAPLAAGACVVVRGAEVPSPAELAAFVRGQGITVVNPPTAYWHQLVDDAPARDAVKAAARLVIAGGEAMRVDAARAWAAAPGGARLLNGYGPTATVVTRTACEVAA
ncbi:MAG TPA: condensation domain-containing protein, partial [Longimicrobium sp.]|nr:condensation domain-containing protein [Longimicrobium sp.]